MDASLYKKESEQKEKRRPTQVFNHELLLDRIESTDNTVVIILQLKILHNFRNLLLDEDFPIWHNLPPENIARELRWEL